MNRSIAVVVVGLIMMLPSAAWAQAAAGSTELQFFGTVNSFVSPAFGGGTDVNTSGTVFVNVGKYLSDKFEIGGGPTISLQTASGQVNGTFGANVFARLFFGSNPTVVPYIGSDFVISDFTVPEGSGGTFLDQSFLAGSFGVKNYLNERAAIDFRGSVGFNASQPSGGQLFQFVVGLTYVF